ncbi:MAG: hypothetical protein AABX27_01440 [Nanoarchaeota archaeon]
MVNKKGAEMSLNFIIIAAIVLVVLIVAILFFTGGASKLIGQQKEVQVMSEQERGLALATCKFACTMKDKDKYNNPSFSESVVKAGLTNCAAFTELGAYEVACLKECKKDDDDSTAVCNGLAEGDCERITGCSWK